MAINKIILRDKHGKVIASDSFAAIERVEVSVGGNVGEPSATSEYNDGVLAINFNNLVGNGVVSFEQTAVSTDDDGINTWRVILKSGKSIDISVKNGSKGNAFRYEDFTAAQLEALRGLQGVQGATGVYNPQTQDFLTTLETTKGQSQTATMTQKAITDELGVLDEKMLANNLTHGQILDYSTGSTVYNWFIDTETEKWKMGSTNNRCSFYPIAAGEILRLQNIQEGRIHVAFLTSNDIAGSNKSPDYVYGTSLIIYNDAQPHYVVVPETANYLYIRRKIKPADAEESINLHLELERMATLQEKVGEIEENAVTRQQMDYAILESEIIGIESINTGNWSPISMYIDSGGDWHRGSDGVNTCKLIPCNPNQIIKAETNATTGLSFHAFFLRDNYQEEGYPPHYAGGIETMPTWSSESKYLVAPSDAAYLYVRVRSGSNLVTAKLSNVKLIKDVIEDSGSDDEKFLVEQTKFLGSGENATLGLVHYSDIHGDSTAVEQLKKVLDKYSTYINDSLVTGDVVHWYAEGTDDSQYPQGYDWWQTSGLAERSLFVLGNHDGATKNTTEYDDKDGTAAWDGKGQQWCYDTYFADYINGLGVTMPTGYDDPNSLYYKACFWHKDYTSAKVRLIGLDGNHRFDGTLDPNNNWAKLTNGIKHDSTEQEEWLIEKLAEAKALGYSVIVCGHYALDDYDNNGVGGMVISQRTNDVTNWHYYTLDTLSTDPKYNYRNRVVSSNAERGWAKGSVNNIANIIQAFVDDGGKFVAYLHGHYHCEMMYYPKNYPDLLCIAAPQTGYTRGGTTISKPFLNASRLSANFICFDTEHSLIKMMRFGSKVNRFLQPMNCICYDYKYKRVINEW